MSYESEYKLEERTMEQLVTQGFVPVTIRNEGDLEENLKVQIERFNSAKLNNCPLTEKEFERIMNHLSGKNVYESAKMLRDKFLLEREDGTNVYIDFIDKDDASKNIYQITNQITVKGKYENRYDVTLLINGLPLVQMELKRRGMAIKQAFNQIERYRKHSFNKGLFRYLQIFVISNGVDTKYFANSDSEILYSHTFFWSDEKNNRITNLQDFCKEFLNKWQLQKMLSKYFIINDTDKVLMILRPYQVFAIEALIKQALETANNGFVFHTTGAGKTLTSFLASNILKSNPKIKKVFFLVDRRDLDTQTTAEFNKFEAGSVDSTDTTKKLVKQIKDKSNKLIVTTIQKMSKALNNEKYNSAMDIYKDEKVIFIIDECHRTQFGDMHNVIKKHFTKAQYFGFTGTPRFEENASQDGRTTADIFQKLLHSYLIKEAIADHNVLGFSVEYIKTFDGQYDANDDAMVEGINTIEVYHSKERIDMIAKHIVDHHHQKTHDKKYSAIFTVDSIDTLNKYYQAFKEINHDLKIAGIYTYSANEESENKEKHSREHLEDMMVDYNKIFKTNWSTDTFKSYHTDVSKKLKTAQIDILLVVEMFLTGFDSKPLNTLYTDKDLKYHSLLQAFSRTNRVEQSIKAHGNIVCYRNIKSSTDKAIRLFSQSDSADDVLMREYEYYLNKFKSELGMLKVVAPTPESMDEIMSEERQKDFILKFRELSKTLLTMKTFVDFEFDIASIGISDQEYEDYKSKYSLIHEAVQTFDTSKVSILNDIDFSIELMHIDKINVSYIMNLLKDINLIDKKQQEVDIENIKTEISRASNPELKKKVSLIDSFLKNVVPILLPGDSIISKYNEFEDGQRGEDIIKFAKDNSIECDLLNKEISNFEFSGVIDKKLIKTFGKDLKFKEKTSLSKKIKFFIHDIVHKYQ